MQVMVTAEFVAGTIPGWAVDKIVDRLPAAAVTTGPTGGDVVTYTVEENGLRAGMWIGAVAIATTVADVCRLRRGQQSEPVAVTARVAAAADATSVDEPAAVATP